MLTSVPPLHADHKCYMGSWSVLGCGQTRHPGKWQTTAEASRMGAESQEEGVLRVGFQVEVLGKPRPEG